MWGTVCFDSVSRRAIVLRTLDSLVAVCGISGIAVAFAAGAGVASVAGASASAGAGSAWGVAAGAAASFAPARSAFTTRPFGPDPVSVARSMPCCDASRRASGLALTRPSPPADGSAGARAGAGGAPGALPSAGGRPWSSAALASREIGVPSSPFTLGSVGSGRPRNWASAGSGVSVPLVEADALSPSAFSVAITVPTFTPSVPSATAMLAIVPSSTASNSIVALSVSISASRSPDLT